MNKLDKDGEMKYPCRTPSVVSNKLDSSPYTLTRPPVGKSKALMFTKFSDTAFRNRALNSAVGLLSRTRLSYGEKLQLSGGGVCGVLRVTTEK